MNTFIDLLTPDFWGDPNPTIFENKTEAHICKFQSVSNMSNCTGWAQGPVTIYGTLMTGNKYMKTLWCPQINSSEGSPDNVIAPKSILFEDVPNRNFIKIIVTDGFHMQFARDVRKTSTLFVETIEKGYYPNLCLFNEKVPTLFKDPIHYIAYPLIPSAVDLSEEDALLLLKHCKESMRCSVNDLIGKLPQQDGKICFNRHGIIGRIFHHHTFGKSISEKRFGGKMFYIDISNQEVIIDKLELSSSFETYNHQDVRICTQLQKNHFYLSDKCFKAWVFSSSCPTVPIFYEEFATDENPGFLNGEATISITKDKIEYYFLRQGYAKMLWKGFCSDIHLNWK